jgi:hypothetical protein
MLTRRRSLQIGRIAVPLIAALGLAVTASAGGAAANPTASDPIHATFHGGNVVNCTQIGLGSSTTLFADGDNSLSGAVTGTVQAHAGGGQEANITAVADGVVIDAIVIKGGPAYNVYLPLPPGSGSEVASHVFPAYPGPYIAPRNPGGNVPALSHWFVCFHGGDVPPPPPPPGPGSLIVSKAIVNPSSVPLTTSYTVHITCDDDTDTTRTLPATGGPAVEGAVTGILANSLCKVTETNPPAGVTPSYNPASAGPTGEGVAVGSGVEVSVTVTNTFPAVGGVVVATPVTPGTPAPPLSPAVVAAQVVTVTPRLTG